MGLFSIQNKTSKKKNTFFVLIKTSNTKRFMFTRFTQTTRRAFFLESSTSNIFLRSYYKKITYEELDFERKNLDITKIIASVENPGGVGHFAIKNQNSGKIRPCTHSKWVINPKTTEWEKTVKIKSKKDLLGNQSDGPQRISKWTQETPDETSTRKLTICELDSIDIVQKEKVIKEVAKMNIWDQRKQDDLEKNIRTTQENLEKKGKTKKLENLKK